MPKARSKISKNVVDPPVQHRLRQTKKNATANEGPVQDQPIAPTIVSSLEDEAVQKAASDILAGSNKNGVLDEDAPTLPAAQPAPRKRGRKATTAADEVDSAPVAKRTKQGGGDDGQLPGRQGKKGPAAKKADTMPRDPLPDRQKRNTHPAGQRAKRRNPQEVAAEQEAKIRAIEEAIQAGERAKQLLAQMNVSEDVLDDGMDVDNPQRISAATGNRKHASKKFEGDSDGEIFDFKEVDAMLNSSESDEEPVQKRKVVSNNKEQSSGSLTYSFSRPKNLQKPQKECCVGRFKTWKRQYVVKLVVKMGAIKKR